MPAPGAAGEVGDVDFLASGLGGGVGEPAAVGREAELNDARLRRLGLHDGEGFAVAVGIPGVPQREGPNRGGWAGLFHMKQITAVGRELGYSERNGRHGSVPGHQGFFLTSATGQARAQRRSRHDRDPGLFHIDNTLAVRRPGGHEVRSPAKGQAGARATRDVVDPDIGLRVAFRDGHALAVRRVAAAALIKVPCGCLPKLLARAVQRDKIQAQAFGPGFVEQEAVLAGGEGTVPGAGIVLRGPSEGHGIA